MLCVCVCVCVCVKKMTKKEKERWRREKHKRKDFNIRAIRALANIKPRENDAIFVNEWLRHAKIRLTRARTKKRKMCEDTGEQSKRAKEIEMRIVGKSEPEIKREIEKRERERERKRKKEFYVRRKSCTTRHHWGTPENEWFVGTAPPGRHNPQTQRAILGKH